MNKSMIQTIVSLTILVAATVGSVNYFASRGYVDFLAMSAKADTQAIAVRLEQKILSDTIMQISQRIWQLEDRNGGSVYSRWIDQSDKDTYRKLQLRLKQLEAEYESMFGKQDGD